MTEKRDSKRVAYRAKLFVADYDGTEYPDPSSYFAAEGRDISVSGISFYSPRPAMPSSLVVVRMGENRPLLAVARVVYCRQESSDTKRFSVGCEFIERIKNT